jgi:hypothetical protein
MIPATATTYKNIVSVVGSLFDSVKYITCFVSVASVSQHPELGVSNQLGPSVEIEVSTAKALLNNLHLLSDADKTILNLDLTMTIVS